MKKVVISAAVAALFATDAAQAQSSVTLYGVLDNGLNYTSNAKGHHAFAMVSGDSAETSFGLKGTEDLGGGLSAIFTLENGTNLNMGTLNEGGRLFGRQAFVGVASSNLGTVTMGRQYDATIDLWSPFTAAGNTIGDLAAHPFDMDNADYDYRFNNSVKYVSPVWSGLQFESVYGFSNSTNFSDNRAFSGGISYGMGPFSAAVAYQWQQGSNFSSTGAVGGDGVFAADHQQNVVAAAKWTFVNGSNVALAYSHVDVYAPTVISSVANIGTQSWSSWKFDNIEINGQYFFAPDLSLIGAYTFTHGNLKKAAGATSQNWNQVALMLNYSLSKRTSLNIQGAYQHTNGKTGTDLDVAHIIGSADLSSSGNQMLYRVAMIHKF